MDPRLKFSMEAVQVFGREALRHVSEGWQTMDGAAPNLEQQNFGNEWLIRILRGLRELNFRLQGVLSLCRKSASRSMKERKARKRTGGYQLNCVAVWTRGTVFISI